MDLVVTAVFIVALLLAILILASRTQPSRERQPMSPRDRRLANYVWTQSTVAEDFHRALGSGTVEELEGLLRRGADVNAQVAFWTPLQRALSRVDAPEVVSLLLRKGANPNGQNLDGDRPLNDLASKNLGDCPRAATARVLISFGADVKAIDRLGATALHHAAADSRCTELIKVLIEAGAEIHSKAPLTARLPAGGGGDAPRRESRTTNGATPLHFTTVNLAIDNAEVLLIAGANPNAQTGDGITPGDIVRAERAASINDQHSMKCDRFLALLARGQ